MKTRIISAVALLPLLLIIVLVLPAWATAALFGACAAIGAYELTYRTGLVREIRLVAYACVMAVLVSFWSLRQNVALASLGITVYMVVLFCELLAAHTELGFDKVCICFVAGVIVPWLLTALVRIRATGEVLGASTGKFLIIYAFILAFTADSAAYFVGRAFGKHKLAPVISPKKTVEGAIGGVAFTVLLVELYTLILHLGFGFQVNYLYGIVYGILGSTVSILGDLAFSVVKRQMGIKDYGNLIPGHGGILDRFDSMVMVAPVTAVLMELLPIAVEKAGLG